MARRFSYTRESLFLDPLEESYLLEAMSDWQSAHGLPLRVSAGYSMYITYPPGDQQGVLVVGRDGLHEQNSLKRLMRVARPTCNELRGLYYPDATPSVNILSQASLYFDEFFLVNPHSALKSIHSPFITERRRARTDERYLRMLDAFMARLATFDNFTLPLKRAGICMPVPPQMQKTPNFLELLTADLSDPEFAAVVKRGWQAPVFMAAKKMEPLLPLIGARRPNVESPEDYRQRVVEVLQERSSDPFAGSSDPQNLFNLDVDAYGVTEVDPVLGASVLLNHAFLLADKFDLIPFTGDPTSMALLNKKLKRVCETPGFTAFQREMKISSATLAVRVLEEYLPRFELKSAEDVITAREKLHAQLADFRNAMAAIAGEIEGTPYDSAFQGRIERAVATKVRPAIEALEREIRTSRDSFIAKFIRNAQTGTVPIVASIFAGLPASAVIAISAGVLTFEAAMETYIDLRRKRRNGLAILLK